MLFLIGLILLAVAFLLRQAARSGGRPRIRLQVSLKSKSKITATPAPQPNIRPAHPGDAPEIASVHINAWCEAYRGLLPQDYLDSLPQTYERRKNYWEKTIAAGPEQNPLFVAVADSGIVGFSCFGEPRDSGFEGYGEVGAIYLLEKFKGQGTGFGLLTAGFRELSLRGIQRAYCWVLEGNPTIRFYERTGAVANGMTKEVELGGQKVVELAYVWSKFPSESQYPPD